MEITYLGHSAFRLKGKNGTVITDPYSDETGLSLPNLTADIVTVSHQHYDHNAHTRVKGTARRPDPFIISYPGEYEVEGISVFGVQSFHDTHKGADRGFNNIYSIFIDEIHVCHLGDLGHELSTAQVEEIGEVDVLLCPVGGFYTIEPELAVKTIHQLEPSYAIPMHYGTPKHSKELTEKLKPLEAFLKEYGVSPTPQPKLNVEKSRLPEETELVVLEF